MFSLAVRLQREALAGGASHCLLLVFPDEGALVTCKASEGSALHKQVRISLSRNREIAQAPSSRQTSIGLGLSPVPMTQAEARAS